MTVEAIALDDQKEQGNKYEIAAQYIQNVQNNTPAGMVEAPKPQCTSVSEIVGDSKPHSVETAAEPLSGRLDAISSTDAKRDVAAVDQKNYGGGKVDPSMKSDIDGDGLVDGLDKKIQTRAEIAREIAEKNSAKARNRIAQSIKRSLKEKNSVGSLSSVSSLISDSDAKNSGLAGRSKNRGPGEIDFSSLDPDKGDKVSGILANEKDF